MRDPPCVFSFKPFLFLDRHLPTLLQLPESMARDPEMHHSICREEYHSPHT